jgi:hypothetical protein
MPQAAFTGPQPLVDLAQALGLVRLAEQHGHELTPTSETFGPPFGAVLAQQRFELAAREPLEKLAENAGDSTQG